jgi:hypothetical protein
VKKLLTFGRMSDNIHLAHGGIAQLGERLNGIQEVSGSIPLISTINRPQGQRLAVLLYPSPVTSHPQKKQVNLQFTCFFCLMRFFLIRICALHQHN